MFLLLFKHIHIRASRSRPLTRKRVCMQLKLEDIAAMKEAGKSGKEIVEALTTHSATFDTKSEFAQEKYKYVCV